MYTILYTIMVIKTLLTYGYYIYIYYILSSTSHLGTHSSTVPTPTDKPVSVETWGMASPMVI